MRQRVAVVGAAGYVGRHLCVELARRGHDVVGIIRARGREELETMGIGVVAAGDVDRVEDVDAVVNLAHPRDGPSYEWPARNRRIVEEILLLARGEARVVHVCTLAVFGDWLEHAVVPGPVPMRRDIPYVEGKLAIQEALMSALPGGELHVVRLGNVWGPGSPAWTARLASRVRAGRPVGVTDHDGYSNVTDVANTASYLAFLVERPRRRGMAFHHLAELGDLHWSHWTSLLARELRFAPVLAPQPDGRGPRASLAGALVAGRVSGSLLRTASRCLPAGARAAIRARLALGRPDDDGPMLRIMSCPRLFACHLQEGWTPPIDAAGAWARVAQWLAEEPASTR